MGCPIHGHPAMACEHCEAVYARAVTNARAEGYAEAVADVVSWLRARAGGLRSPPRSLERAVLERVMDGIEDACHVGAAKKGGE